MLPSPYSCRLGLWGHSLSRPHLRSLSLRPNGSRHPKDDLVDRLQRFSFLPPCYPSYEASDVCPGGTHLPLNTPTFAARTTARAVFAYAAFTTSPFRGGAREGEVPANYQAPSRHTASSAATVSSHCSASVCIGAPRCDARSMHRVG